MMVWLFCPRRAGWRHKQQGALIAERALETLRSNYVPSCWPPHFAVAPVTDYSVLDSWRSSLPADCSAFRTSRPALATDLTRRPTLNALRRTRIAPHSTLDARAGRRSLRATDRSVVQHLELRPACGLLRTRHLSGPHRLWIAPLSAACTLPRSRIAPRSALDAP
jgi:hypothetical protein